MTEHQQQPASNDLPVVTDEVDHLALAGDPVPAGDLEAEVLTALAEHEPDTDGDGIPDDEEGGHA